jgi:phosphate transport system substrate-binding protein
VTAMLEITTRRFAALFLLLILFAWGPATSAAAEQLRIGGTGAALGLMRRLGDAFADRDAGTTVHVMPSMGSAGAVAAARDNALDVAMSGRALNPADVAAGLRAALWLSTPAVLVTSRPIAPPLELASLAANYAEPSPRWPDGQPLRVILRPEGESSVDVLISRAPGLAAAIQTARQRRTIPVAATDQDNLEIARTTPGSLTVTTLLQITTEAANVRVASLDGVVPSAASMSDGSYVLCIDIQIVLPPRSSATAERFLQFLRSPEAAAIIRESGAVPHDLPDSL